MIDYKNTLNLPNTQRFPMKANLVKWEPVTLINWNKDNVYKMIRQTKNNRKIFLLHDGPIYANGTIHLGHAVNKILKDIVIKYKGLMGYDAPFIPGWDCHGLPIELKVEQFLRNGKDNISINSKEFCKICRNYALEQIEIQKKDFIRLGILGNWENPYLTMDFKIEANTIRTLSKVVSSNYVYKGKKPVYWCFQCYSVLAESEIEYNNNHCSIAIDVIFFSIDNARIARIFNINFILKSVGLIIWTTTPWTLPANQAIAVHSEYYYQLVQISNDKYVIIASDLVTITMSRIACASWKILGETVGSALEFLKFRHPFMPIDIFVVLSSHVSNEVGTGAVHIAPNHGIEDYCVAKKYDLKIVDMIDDKGFYIITNQPILNGVRVLQADNIIVNLLEKKGALLSMHSNYQHSYPYCCRHMTPVIFRNTSQWFISMERFDFRNQLLEAIDQVCWIKKRSRLSVESMIINRPDWCISRQRLWGVPIPFFIHKETEDLHPRTIELMEIIAQLVEKNGIQIWWDLKVEDIIGSDAKKYNKVLDTLDVWFDSGATHYSVVPYRSEYLGKLPDLYLEGSDQYRGWFMSSLVLSTAIRGKAPYKEVLSHGFTVDFQGHKMSKSLGNVVSPQKIVNSFGADILRLWVSLSDYSKDMIISDEILKYTIDVYRRIRNTARFCLVNLDDFDPELNSVQSVNMVALDRWAVDRAFSVQSQLISYYNKYNFHDVVRSIMQFCSIDMGSFYFDVIKDRQYTTKKNKITRRSCQTALYHIIEALVRWISPILSFTADEIWRNIPGTRSKYVFTEEWYTGLFQIDSADIMNNDFWSVFFKVRSEVNKVIEQERTNGVIRGSLEASVYLFVNAELASKLRILENELAFGLIVSSVTILDHDDLNVIREKKKASSYLKVVLKKAEGKKCARCWHYRIDIGECIHHPTICTRCVNNIIGDGEKRKFF